MAVFKETQYLSPIIRWGAVVFAAIMTSLGILGAIKGISDDSWISLVVSLIVGPFVVVLMLFMRLEIRLSTTGITSRLFPLEMKDQQIAFSDIESVKVHKLPKFGSYGGFGKRRKPWKKQVAYIMNRKNGLTVHLKDGKIRVFSIENEKKLRTFLQANYGRLTGQNKNNEKV